MSKRPLKATDRRRNSGKRGITPPEIDDLGEATPLANLFHDRRKPNGHGKKAF